MVGPIVLRGDCCIARAEVRIAARIRPENSRHGGAAASLRAQENSRPDRYRREATTRKFREASAFKRLGRQNLQIDPLRQSQQGQTSPGLAAQLAAGEAC